MMLLVVSDNRNFHKNHIAAGHYSSIGTSLKGASAKCDAKRQMSNSCRGSSWKLIFLPAA